MSIAKTIKALEQKLNITLSNEQKQIVLHNLTTPTLVNACAGSGKTMLVLFLMQMKIKSQQNQPHQILGITFSHQAKLDMQKRYIQDSGTSSNIPYFSTFHALFFHLLIASHVVKQPKVLTSYTKLYRILDKHLPHTPKYMSISQLLQKIFQTRGQLINQGFTSDGLHLLPNANYMQIREGTKWPKLIFRLVEPQNKSDRAFLDNYRVSNQIYNQFKSQHGYIDFSDMQTLLWCVLNTSQNATKKIQQLMSQFQLVFIDEFQDISTLQWKIMKKILSSKALQHITLIGDDDQSIYSFRGSNPSIILNLHKNYPHLVTFNLSTNYRTGGNILESVRPLITTNQYRLPKQLNTANKGKGQLIEYLSNDKRYSANIPLLRNLVRQIKNPKVNNQDIAVLLHFNNSRTILIDWLNNHDIFFSSKPKWSIQDTIKYKALMDFLQAFVFNHLKAFIHFSAQIKFKPYTRHIKSILSQLNIKASKSAHKGRISYLSQYLKVLPLIKNKKQGQYNNLTLSWSKKRRTILKIPIAKNFNLPNYQQIEKTVQADDTDGLVFACFQLVQYKTSQFCKKYHINLGKFLWSIYQTLTKDHDYFLLKKRYINSSNYWKIQKYLKQQILQINTPQELVYFMQWQKNKIKANKQNANNINILSLHQSKGLQFKYVYLYDLNSQIDTIKSILINRQFPPNLTLVQFLQYLIKTPINNIKQLEAKMSKDKANPKSPEQDRLQGFSKLAKALREIQRKIPKLNVIGSIEKRKFHHNHLQAAIMEQAWQLYHDVIHTSQAVEEQRRLIYVGCTRAEQRLYVAYNRNADPLLNELQIPRKSKFYLEPTQKILNYSNNQKLLQQFS